MDREVDEVEDVNMNQHNSDMSGDIGVKYSHNILRCKRAIELGSDIVGFRRKVEGPWLETNDEADEAGDVDMDQNNSDMSGDMSIEYSRNVLRCKGVVELGSDIAGFGREIEGPWPEMNNGRCDKEAA